MTRRRQRRVRRARNLLARWERVAVIVFVPGTLRLEDGAALRGAAMLRRWRARA